MVESHLDSAPDAAVHGHRTEDNAGLVGAIRSAVRTSPWLTIAISVHVLAGAIFGIVRLAGGEKQDAPTGIIEAGIAKRMVTEAPPEELPPEVINRQAIPENEEREIVSTEVPEFTNSQMDPNEDLTKERGDPNAVDNLPPGSTGGTSIGIGSGGHYGTGAPAPFASRKLGSGGKVANGGRGGGPTEKTEKAVKEGLTWLARHQESTGEWSARKFMEHCPVGKPCQPETAGDSGVYDNRSDIGMTSLAVLAFLGAGYGHDAKQNLVDTVNARRIYVGKDIVKPALQWLVDHQNEDGSFTGSDKFFLYNEALATLALSEAYGLRGSRYWKEPAQRAIDFICKAQKPNPKNPAELWGWRYEPVDVLRKDNASADELSDADMSVTGWMVMALKSAEAAGLNVPEASIKGAMDFTKWSTGRKGQVGYLGPDTAGQPVMGDHDNFQYHIGTMSSIGMCVRIFLEHDLKDPALFESADVLLADLPSLGKDPKHPGVDYYYWYYGSLALNQIDGPDAPRRTNKYWGPWNKAMQETLLELQDKSVNTCSSGGWMVPDRWSYGVGPVYTTAINVLTLEVYYRYANAFGAKDTSARPRSEGAKPTEADAPEAPTPVDSGSPPAPEAPPAPATPAAPDAPAPPAADPAEPTPKPGDGTGH